MSDLSVTAQISIPVSEVIETDDFKLTMNVNTLSTYKARVLHTPAVYSNLIVFGKGRAVRIQGTHYQIIKEAIDFNNAQLVNSDNPDDCVSTTGQTTAGITYYANSVDIKVAYAIGWGGIRVHPSIHFSRETQQLISDIQFDGTIYVEYRISYYFIDYYPEITDLPGGGVQADWGILLAYRGSSKARVDFPQFQLETPNEFEVCEVYFEYVADEDGAHEKPKDWPDDPYYPGYSEIEPPEPDGSQLLERQVRIWFVSPLIGLSIKDLNPAKLPPYQTDAFYKPEYKFRIHSPPSDTWALKEYNRINFQAIRAEVSSRYGISF